MIFRFGAHAALPAAALSAAILAAPVPAQALQPNYDSGGTRATNNLLRDASSAAYHGRYGEAIELDSKAIAAAPNFGRAYWARADHYTAAGRYTEAATDLDRVTAMHPDDFRLPIQKAKLALYRGDATTALAILKVAANMPPQFAWHDFDNEQFIVNGHAASYIVALSSIAEQMLHQDDASIADMTIMVKNERQFPVHIMSFYCWSAAVSGLLESAELTCQQAIDTNSHDIGQYDSMGYVQLRMKHWAEAIANYNLAINNRPDLTTSLYGRGIARRATGDIAGGNADIAAATRNEPDIANIMKRLHAPVI